MTYKITALRSKDLPSRFSSGTWKLIEVKLEGQGDTIFELQGYGKEKEKFAVGTELQGYLGSRSWTGQQGVIITQTLNKISAEYVYGLLLALHPDIESVAKSVAPASVVPATDGFTAAPGF